MYNYKQNYDNWDEMTDNSKWDVVRRYRNFQLTQSDWTQLPDSPILNTEEWITYRQELRDLTETFTNPDDVVFPDEP